MKWFLKVLLIIAKSIILKISISRPQTKENAYKAGEVPNYRKEVEMVRRYWTKKRKNVASLITGIVLILVGMSGTSISLLSLGFKSGWNIPPFLFLILGIILAYLGASEKWH